LTSGLAVLLAVLAFATYDVAAFRGEVNELSTTAALLKNQLSSRGFQWRHVREQAAWLDNACRDKNCMLQKAFLRRSLGP
jgi:hypothetical protein